MSLRDDWKKYIKDTSAFDKHHFESLMLELDTKAALVDAFEALPNGRKFVDIITNLRKRANSNGTYLFASPGTVTESDHLLVRAYCDSISDYLRDIGDPESGQISGEDIVEIPHDEYRIKKRAGQLKLLQAPTTIDDEYIDARLSGPKWLGGLYEAVYMMTTVPEVTRYLLSPFVKYPLNEEPAFELWLRGHRVDFCESHALLIVGRKERASHHA